MANGNGSKRVTMKDIAARVGVTQQSVSEVLTNNPKSRISTDTRRRIMTAARELKYRPNYLASSLKKGKTDTIGFLGEEIEFHNQLIMANSITASGIEKALPDHKAMLIFSSNGPRGVEKSLALARRGVVDGMIIKIYPYHYEMLRERIIPELDGIGLPFVVIHPSVVELPCTALGIDRVRAGYLLGRQLAAADIREIGVFISNPKHDGADAVTRGVEQAVTESGIAATVKTFATPAYREGETMEQTMAAMLDGLSALPRSLVFPSTAHAEAAYRHLRLRDVLIPEDVVIAAQGPLLGSDHVLERIILAGVALEEQGQQATELLLKMIDGTILPGQGASRLMEPHLLNA